MKAKKRTYLRRGRDFDGWGVIEKDRLVVEFPLRDTRKEVEENYLWHPGYRAARVKMVEVKS